MPLIHLSQVQNGSFIKNAIDNFKMLTEVIESVNLKADNETTFKLSHIPSLDQDPKLRINGVDYPFSEGFFNIDIPTKTITWNFGSNANGFDIKTDFQVKIVYFVDAGAVNKISPKVITFSDRKLLTGNTEFEVVKTAGGTVQNLVSTADGEKKEIPGFQGSFDNLKTISVALSNLATAPNGTYRILVNFTVGDPVELLIVLNIVEQEVGDTLTWTQTALMAGQYTITERVVSLEDVYGPALDGQGRKARLYLSEGGTDKEIPLDGFDVFEAPANSAGKWSFDNTSGSQNVIFERYGIGDMVYVMKFIK